MHLNKLPLLLAATCLLSVPFHAGECLQGEEIWDYPTEFQPHPFEISYEGPFPETSEGASIRAFLDEEKALKVLKLEYMQETGRSAAIFSFRNPSSYTVSWIEEDYRSPITLDKTPEVKSTSSSCWVIERGKVHAASEDSNSKLLEGLQDHLRLALDDYLPCRLSAPFPAPD